MFIDRFCTIPSGGPGRAVLRCPSCPGQTLLICRKRPLLLGSDRPQGGAPCPLPVRGSEEAHPGVDDPRDGSRAPSSRGSPVGRGVRAVGLPPSESGQSLLGVLGMCHHSTSHLPSALRLGSLPDLQASAREDPQEDPSRSLTAFPLSLKSRSGAYGSPEPPLTSAASLPWIL